MEAETLSTNLKSKLEAETSNHDCPPGFVRRSLPSFVPMLLISLGYVDPGKWVASVEGGARFGFDLMAFTLIFNFAAIFCQYISARIGVITERDLAQVLCLPLCEYLYNYTIDVEKLSYLKIFCSEQFIGLFLIYHLATHSCQISL